MSLHPKIFGNFKDPVNPNRKREPKARERREGMSQKHLGLIRQLPSCISGRTPCDPHHLRIAGERGVALKATDRWCVPLTREEHHEVHKVGSRREEEWFLQHNIACYVLARALWNVTGNVDEMRKIVATHRAMTLTDGERE